MAVLIITEMIEYDMIDPCQDIRIGLDMMVTGFKKLFQKSLTLVGVIFHA